MKSKKNLIIASAVVVLGLVGWLYGGDMLGESGDSSSVESVGGTMDLGLLGSTEKLAASKPVVKRETISQRRVRMKASKEAKSVKLSEASPTKSSTMVAKKKDLKVSSVKHEEKNPLVGQVVSSEKTPKNYGEIIGNYQDSVAVFNAEKLQIVAELAKEIEAKRLSLFKTNPSLYIEEYKALDDIEADKKKINDEAEITRLDNRLKSIKKAKEINEELRGSLTDKYVSSVAEKDRSIKRDKDNQSKKDYMSKFVINSSQGIYIPIAIQKEEKVAPVAPIAPMMPAGMLAAPAPVNAPISPSSLAAPSTQEIADRMGISSMSNKMEFGKIVDEFGYVNLDDVPEMMIKAPLKKSCVKGVSINRMSASVILMIDGVDKRVSLEGNVFDLVLKEIQPSFLIFQPRFGEAKNYKVKMNIMDYDCGRSR